MVRGFDMITIKDKKDSVVKMKEMRLNYFPLDSFEVDDFEGIADFMEKYPAKEYVLRSANKAKGDFYFVANMEEAKEKLPLFDGDVTLCVSYNEYKEDIVLVGDIIVHKNGGSDTLDLTARTDTEATHRNIYENPEYNLHASLDDDRVWRIPGFSKIMRYISDHELYDVIIEFTVYDCRIGVNKENVVISELRTGY